MGTISSTASFVTVSGMIESQPMRHAPAAVVTHEPERVEAQALHNLHLIERHFRLEYGD